MIDFTYYIIGCIVKYNDFDTAKKWLVRAKEELDPVCFFDQINSLFTKLFEIVGPNQLEQYVSRISDKDISRVYAEVIDDLRIKALAAEEVVIKRKQEMLAIEKAEHIRNEDVKRRRKEFEEQKQKEELEKSQKDALDLLVNEIESYLKNFQFDKAKAKYYTYRQILLNYDFNKSCNEFQTKQKVEELRGRISEYLKEDNFIAADRLASSCSATIPIEEYENIKSGYIRKYFKKNFPKAAVLSNEQFLAISDTSQNLLLRARAGSGKTTTLSSKISYLINCEKIEPNKIIALCFNRDAAKNIIKKLKKNFDIEYCEKQNITTFHSLAGQISPAGEGVDTLFDDKNPLAQQKLTILIERLLNNKWEHPFHDLEKDEISDAANSIYGFLKKLLVIVKFAAYKHVVYAIAREDKRFNTDEETIELTKRGILYGSKEHYLFRRNLSYITLDGKHVKSFGEKVIADYLFEHDIPYQYEPNIRMNNHTYYPDFQLYNNNIIIEHWGIDEFDKNKKTPINWSKTWGDYVGEMNEKRAFWKRYNKNESVYNLLETNITQLREGREVFEKIISEKLEIFGVKNEKLSVEEIINKISKNLKQKFSEKLKNYIQKAKQNRYSPGEMMNIIDNAGYAKYDKEYIFLKLANIIYKQYEDEKVNSKKIDYYDYLINASSVIEEKNGNCILRSGTNIKDIEWLLIDEFQDFSPLFLVLIKVIKKYNPKVKLFCVGDDWQAINSFSGSDVEIFNNFKKEFPTQSAIKNLAVNWRSNQDLVNFGNKIMVGCGVVSSADPNKRENAIIEYEDVNSDINYSVLNIPVTKAEFCIDCKNVDVVLLRYLDRVTNIIDKYLERLKNDPEFKLLILSRKSYVRYLGKDQFTLDNFLEKVEIFFIQKYPVAKNLITDLFSIKVDKDKNEYRQIESKTAHQSKGLEADVVILLEATNRSFPLIHPDYQLFEIFGDTLGKIEDEERRLFYVACTRAKSDLYLLYDEDFDKKKALTEFCTKKFDLF